MFAESGWRGLTPGDALKRKRPLSLARSSERSFSLSLEERNSVRSRVVPRTDFMRLQGDRFAKATV
jgi:hypothetical protein